MSMPWTSISKGIGCRPTSASPRCTTSPTLTVTSRVFGLSSAEIPSFSTSSARYCPLVAPLAGSAKATDLALTRAFLKASTELMSGLGVPFFTATPIWARASVVAVPPTILASRTSLSARGLVRIATSISSSAATFFSMTSAVAYSILSLCPEALSKVGASSCKTGRMALTLNTFSSAALAVVAHRQVARAKLPASNRIARIIVPPLKARGEPARRYPACRPPAVLAVYTP